MIHHFILYKALVPETSQISLLSLRLYHGRDYIYITIFVDAFLSQELIGVIDALLQRLKRFHNVDVDDKQFTRISQTSLKHSIF